MAHSGVSAQFNPGVLFAVTLAAISFIGPLAVHVFLPIIPGVRAAFAVGDGLAQLAFSISLFTMAFATLVYGSLADRIGRRPALLSGLALFLVGTFLCSFANSIETLLAGRFIQALGAGCGVTLVRTIARDAYGPQRLVKAIAYLTMAYTMGPLLAPLIGGSLHDLFGWRSVFAFALACGAAIAALSWFVVPETRQSAAAGGRANSILRDYRDLFAHWRFVAFVLQTGMSTAVFYTMAAAAAVLMKDALDRPAAEYGLWFFAFPIGYFAGNWLATRYTARARVETMVLIGTLIGMATAIVQSAFLLGGVVNPLVLFLPGFLTTFAQGIALPYAQAGAMNTLPRLTGTASGIGVFLQNFLGGAATLAFGLIYDGGPAPMVAVVMASSVLMTVAGVLPWLFPRPAAGEDRERAGL